MELGAFLFLVALAILSQLGNALVQGSFSQSACDRREFSGYEKLSISSSVSCSPQSGRGNYLKAADPCKNKQPGVHNALLEIAAAKVKKARLPNIVCLLQTAGPFDSETSSLNFCSSVMG
jgi:hypothetical protein